MIEWTSEILIAISQEVIYCALLLAVAVFSTWKKDRKVTIVRDGEMSDATARQRAKAKYRPLEDEWRPPGEPGERATCSIPGYTGDLCQFRESHSSLEQHLGTFRFLITQ